MKNNYTFRKIATALFALLFIFSAVVSSSAQDVNKLKTGKGRQACLSQCVIPVSPNSDEGISSESLFVEQTFSDTGFNSNAENPGNNDAPASPNALSGTYTIAAGQTYTTLSAAITALNTNGVSGPCIFIIGVNTSISSTLSINQITGASATNTITFYPNASGLTITSTSTTGTLDLTGSDYIIFDGRVNKTGSTADLAIVNSTTSGYAVQLRNGATYNVFQYCKIKGRNTSTTSGLVFFTTGTPGNSNNTIDYCEITYDNVPATAPRNLIYSSGTAGQNNNSNTVSNSNLHDYFQSGAGQSSAICISANSSTWTITGNSFYNSTNRVSTANSCYVYDIYCNSGDGYTISNNYFGGQSPNCGGSPYSIAGAFTNRFYNIYFTSSVSQTNTCSIQGNTIKNISFSSVGSSGAIPYVGIYLTRGKADIGTTSGNTIGATTGNSSIVLTLQKSSFGSNNYSYHSAIRYEGNSATISNNNIGSIDLADNATNGTDVACLYLIYVVPNSPVANITVNNNSIGSTSTASSIRSIGAGTYIYKQLKGIYTLPSGSYYVTVSNNTVANLNLNNIKSNTGSSTGPSSFLNGIDCMVYSSYVNVTGNTIRDMTSAGRSQFTDASAAVSGITIDSISSGTNYIAQNTIYNLKSTESGNYAVTANGILAGGRCTIERNLVYNLSLATASRAFTSGVNGFQVDPKSGGTITMRNNMARLGLDETGASLTNGNSFAGIWLVATKTTGTCNIYNNTLFITGDNSQDCPVLCASIFSETQCTRSINNNILYNNRTSANKNDEHFALILGTTGTINCDYNNYYRPGGDVYATFTQANTDGSYTQIFDIDDWQDAKPYDDHSVYNEPGFITEGTGTPNLHMRGTAGTCSNKGMVIASVTNDYDGDARNSPPDIGADEFSTPTIIVWNGSNSTDWNNTSNWDTPVVPKWADMINIPAGQSRYPDITASYAASAYDVTIGAGASITIEPNASLDIRGAVTNSNGTDAIYIKSDATGTGSLIQRDNLVEGYIERFVSGSTDTHLRRYHTVSIPLDESYESVTGLFLNSYLFYFSEPDNDWVAMGAPTQTPISEARGYLIYYVFGSDTTYSFQGPMKSGAFYPNVSGTFSGAADNLHGWNLIPNPYPSAINWSSRGGWSKSGVDNAVYVWKPGATYAAGDYASWVGGISVNGGTNYIPVGQGFFVHTNTTTPSIRMRNSSRVHNTTTFLKNAEAPLQDVFKLKIENSVGVTDELAVRFSESATEDFDIELDAYGMGSESMVPNISTTSGLLKYGINSLPYVHGNRVIPVNIEYGQVEELTFTASGMESFKYTPPILLEDTYLNQIQDLRFNPEYTFSFKPDQTHRFNLIFTNVDATEKPEESGWLIYKSGKKINMYLPEINGKEAFVSIFDMTGRNLLTEQMQFDGVEQVDSPLTTGVYIVKVVSGKKTYTKKLVVE